MQYSAHSVRSSADALPFCVFPASCIETIRVKICFMLGAVKLTFNTHAALLLQETMTMFTVNGLFVTT